MNKPFHYLARRVKIHSMTEITNEIAVDQTAEDLTELQFTPIPAADASETGDRLYLLGVRSELVR